MEKKNRVLVIGGGAAGLIASIIAGRNGADVMLLEQMQRVGKKILATGNGRCNITNKEIKLDRYHGEKVEFATEAFNIFDVNNTLKFFDEIGISCREEEEGKIYPYSGQASSVLDVLRYELQKLNVEERCEAEVKKILPNKNEFILILKDGTKVIGDKVIIATGGKANANLGSTGTGYKLATDLGHKLVEPFPALVQLKLGFQHLKALSGVKFVGSAAIIHEDKIGKEEYGEILFTDYGISGPPILQLSRYAGEKLNDGIRTILRLDMFPEYSIDDVMKIIKRKIQSDGNKPLDFSLVGFLNKKLIPTVLKTCGITDIHRICSEITDDEIMSIVNVLKSWDLEITGTQPWRDAQVTAGGIATKDINSKTMESKIVKGLYLCGEIVDIDGDCGGFNLQWAWSSGYLAGLNASKK